MGIAAKRSHLNFAPTPGQHGASKLVKTHLSGYFVSNLSSHGLRLVPRVFGEFAVEQKCVDNPKPTREHCDQQELAHGEHLARCSISDS